MAISSLIGRLRAAMGEFPPPGKRGARCAYQHQRAARMIVATLPDLVRVQSRSKETAHGAARSITITERSDNREAMRDTSLQEGLVRCPSRDGSASQAAIAAIVTGAHRLVSSAILIATGS